MADRNGYIGRAPGDNPVIIARQTYNPTGVQTNFTFDSGYTPGYLDVYLNGVKLIVATDYTATDTSIVGLTSAAQNGDILEFVAYKAFDIASVGTAEGAFTVGTDLTVTRNATIGGDISGRNFTGVAATFTGNVSVGGSLIYEDVYNVDSLGIITARSGIIVNTGGIDVSAGGLNVVGVTTLTQLTSGPAVITGISTISNVTGTTLNATGVSTFSNVVVGGATTELVVTGDARVTGILTVGTASLTLNGTTGAITGGSLTNAQVAAISSDISDTAVDVFVYDTRKDSDGGAWRKRTQHTSWYNETLNTATRGSRKEFPAVAVIVMQEGTLTIYDGDDPDLPMWMVFTDNNDTGSQFASAKMLSCRTATSIFMLNGMLMCGGQGPYHDGATEINFLTDSAKKHMNNGYYYNTLNISQRETTGGYFTVTSGTPSIVSNLINDVAMTVLPNAPIDDTTGLPVPTIAVATNGGLSIIRDDGTVTSPLTGTHVGSTIDISDYFVLYYGNESQGGYYPYDVSTASYIGNGRLFSSNVDGPVCLLNNISSSVNQTVRFGKNNEIAIGMDGGLNLISGNVKNSLPDIGMIAYSTSDYNTGWMHGDIKGAFLSDTTAESLTANTNLASSATQAATARLTSETYTDGATSWQMVDNAGNDNGYLQITFGGLTAGQSYHLSMTVDANAALDAGYEHKIELAGSITYLTHWNGTGAGTLTVNFTAVSGTNSLTFYVNGITVNVTNFNIRAVDDEDRSVNNNGLAVYGTITKSAVATGADLVAYSGFSNSNYLQQPYSSDLNFDSGDFSISAWIYPTVNDADYKGIISRGGNGVYGPYSLAYNNQRVTFVASDDWNESNGTGNWGTIMATTDGVTPINQWHHIVVTHSGTIAKVYKNGKVIGTDTSAVNPKAPTTNFLPTMVGAEMHTVSGTISRPFQGSLALIRVSASAPSEEQIKKIYEDEKVLFQENAKATLYGSSDAVTALAFDEDTNLLHVGTSSGRSDFQGLRRINNTTTAVTTAISASNDLVAEQ